MMIMINFFSSSTIKTHTRTVYGVFGAFGDIGGILEVFVLLFSALLHPYNEMLHNWKLFEKLFRVNV